MMGKVWSVDAVAKNQSTDIYGQLVTIAESYFDENNIAVGTDDGLIHITNDGGKNWTKIDNIQGVPNNTYVNQIIASKHNKNVFYAVFNHHRYGDFKPYFFKSSDGGKTWLPKQGDLPLRGSIYSIEEDHVNTDLLFAGTEFGLFFTINGGINWVQLKGGLPTTAIRDIAIQKADAMIHFCEKSICRSQQVIAYFGQSSEPCGTCDVCQINALPKNSIQRRILDLLEKPLTLNELSLEINLPEKETEEYLREFLKNEVIIWMEGKFYLN